MTGNLDIDAFWENSRCATTKSTAICDPVMDGHQSLRRLAFRGGVLGLIAGGDVCLLTSDDIQMPHWRCRELFADDADIRSKCILCGSSEDAPSCPITGQRYITNPGAVSD